MNEPHADKSRAPIGWILALAIGPLAAVGMEIVLSQLRDRPFNLEWDIFLLKALLISTPFVAVALTRTRRKAPWLVGLALTAGLWGYALYYGVSYQPDPDGSGVSIGLGVIVLVSPVFITAACLTVHWLQRRAGR